MLLDRFDLTDLTVVSCVAVTILIVALIAAAAVRWRRGEHPDTSRWARRPGAALRSAVR